MLNGNTDLADDFLQDLFIKIIEKPDLFSQEKKISTWIYTIASNMCKNQYRRTSIRKEVKTENSLEHFYNEEETISTNIDKKDFEVKLKEEIESLDEQNREILILRFQENLPVKEISLIVNLPEGTIKSRLFYTIKKLSAKLKIYHHH